MILGLVENEVTLELVGLVRHFMCTGLVLRNKALQLQTLLSLRISRNMTFQICKTYAALLLLLQFLNEGFQVALLSSRTSKHLHACLHLI